MKDDLISRSALGIGKCNPDVFEDKGYANGWNSAIEIIEYAPTVDAVEVVRCGECVNWNEKEQECRHFYFFRTDDFCSYGERKDND